jgi:hypothetical protein
MTIGKLTILSVGVLAAPLLAQQNDVFQNVICMKIQAGKAVEYRSFVESTTKKAMQAGIDAGHYMSWSLLRGVYPTGTEARCDYLSVISFDGPPKAPVPPKTESSMAWTTT